MFFSKGGGARERERNEVQKKTTESQIRTDRQTNRQTDRQTDRQPVSQTQYTTIRLTSFKLRRHHIITFVISQIDITTYNTAVLMSAFKRQALHESNGSGTTASSTDSAIGTTKPYAADSPLPSVAMRIRKAVSEGYNQGQASNFLGNYQRVPLPTTLNNQPPSLSSSESTRTVSNLEEWDSYYKINNAPIQTIDEYDNSSSSFNNPLKRKFDGGNGNIAELEIAQFQARYGELKFNEKF